ncbi:MAG: hypothetical protein RLZZ324_429 [Candidatus Parcubacteria bacterium]|jgi:hypothetical protein
MSHEERGTTDHAPKEEGGQRASLFFASSHVSHERAAYSPPESAESGDRDMLGMLVNAGAVVIFAVSCLLVGAASGGRDTLLQYAPANTALYAHASSRESAELLLARDPQAPTDVHPTEAAFLLLRDDPSFAYGRMLLAWRGLQGPSASERAALSADGAVSLDARAFLIGAALPPGGGSLDADADVRTALASARSVNAVQGFADFNAIAPMMGTTASAKGFAGFGRLVFAASAAADGALRVSAASLSSASLSGASGTKSLRPWSIIAHSHQTRHTAAPAITARGAKLVVHGPASDYSPFDLLFGNANLTRMTKDKNARTAQESAALRETLSAGTALSLMPETAASHRQDVLLHLPGISPKVLMDRLSRFASHAWPARSPLRLPDGTVAPELMANLNLYHYTAVPGHVGAVSLALSDSSTVSIGPDDRGGSVLTTNVSLLNQFERGSPELKANCSMVGNKWITMVLSPQDIPASIAPYIRFSHITLGENVDNRLYFCGYGALNGDK